MSKITGELGNYSFDVFNRNDYYITQSPEAFRFKLLYECFDPDAKLQKLQTSYLKMLNDL